MGEKKKRLASAEAHQNVSADTKLCACIDVQTLGRAQPGPLEAGLGVGGASLVRCKHNELGLGWLLPAAHAQLTKSGEKGKTETNTPLVDYNRLETRQNVPAEGTLSPCVHAANLGRAPTDALEGILGFVGGSHRQG